jgi:2-haloacid dehalogenase
LLKLLSFHGYFAGMRLAKHYFLGTPATTAGSCEERPLPIKAFVFDVYGTLYNPQSVATAIEVLFPGYGDYLAYVWRQKQLEYSWLRTAMGCYADFAVVTRDALIYALATLALSPSAAAVDGLCQSFDRLAPFSDAATALNGLTSFRLAILSNGSPTMLSALLGQSNFARHFEEVISVDRNRVYKPHPSTYRSVAEALALAPEEILLISSNGFDLAGAKQFGLKTLRIKRAALDPPREGDAQPLRLVFSALRSQLEAFGGEPDFECSSLLDIVTLAPSIAVRSTP